MAAERAFDGLDLTQDEVKRLGNALKDEKFRKMLIEYAEEISNPENKRKAEEEIAMMEQERGMNVQFIHPQPGYVLKTTVDGSTKTFINICQNDKIDKPVAKRQVGPDGKNGLMWQIPHSFAPPREDYDKSKKTCKVFDVVFHPDTYRMAMKNERFCKLVEDTAVDGIENQFAVKLDKKNLKHPKLKYKGTPTATVIRERIGSAEKKSADPDSILNQFPYPYDDKTSSEKAKENAIQNGNKAAKKISTPLAQDKFTEPNYTITHRSQVDMSEYRNSPDAKTSTRPTELSIKIELPLLKTAAQANLEIYEKRLVLESVAPALYKLDIKLPYPVNEDEGSAKFDKSKRTLTITLPVIPLKSLSVPFNGLGENEKCETETNVIDDMPPLIEILKEQVNGVVEEDQIEQESMPSTEAVVKGESEDVKNKPKYPGEVKWQLPKYQFSQDNETMNFVLKVNNADSTSIDLDFPGPSDVSIRFKSIGAGLFPVYYSLYLEFSAGCHISPDHSCVDVSNENLVLLLLKDKTSRGLWDAFKSGVDSSYLEEKHFLTEGNLQRELSRLAQEPDMPSQEESLTPQLSVVEMSEKKLTIDIKPPKGKNRRKSRKDSVSSQEEEEEDEYDESAPSSAEIQVIHKHPTPKNLHSILKQRTVSESSEDFGHNNADLPESPRSEGEEQLSSNGGLKKHRSVSFNSHVDRTSFKAFASVSSMTPTLKSKRRRQRKREERLKRRFRSNSEGGTSSGEECSGGRVCLSHSEGEDEELSASKYKAGLSRSISDPGTITGIESFNLSPIADKLEEDEDESKLNDSSDSLSEKTKSKVSETPGSTKELDFRTSSSKGNFEKNENFQLIEGSSGDVIENTRGQSSEIPGMKEQKEKPLQDVNNTEIKHAVDKNKRIAREIKTKLADNCVSGNIGGGDVGQPACEVEDSDDDDFVDAVSSLADEMTSKVNCEDCTADATSRDENLNSSQGAQKIADQSPEKMSDEVNAEKQVTVDTVLSWKEGEVGNEHRTECAFQFSNSVMFDLDVD
ncbi:protein kintoun [Plakobranchus ocellatus]|uniref:Protein kintoun n=1 Tax=Plakobranchus ocellatus TaxID=259542 RepID=A0AAV3XT09_9GAST|nr:protein kintoun [Plakobranchus ocellatus]